MQGDGKVNTPRKLFYIFSGAFLALSLSVLFLPAFGRIVYAILLVPLAAAVCFFMKKRSILSINRRQVLLITTVTALMWLMLLYLSGLHFGFYRSPYPLDLSSLLRVVLPITVIIVSTELIRYVMLCQSIPKRFEILSRCPLFVCCVLSSVIATSSVASITSFQEFMDAVGLALLPGIATSIMCDYVCTRYGPLPNITYRFITVIYTFVLPYTVNINDAILAFFGLVLPLALLWFLKLLYEKKEKKKRTPRRLISIISGAAVAVVMVLVMMLISCHFKYGALVIASESMTGEINKGDAVIYERYDGGGVDVGEVIIFNKENTVTVHRVIDVKEINGSCRYYTKGDANNASDSGYVTENMIVGVVHFKIAHIGQPTLWMRELFLRN